MEYSYQNSVEDFKVKFTLVVPENSPSEFQLSEEEQAFLKELDEANKDISNLSNHADWCDYALAVSSGIISGLIDSFFVGVWDFKNAKKQANIEINNIILNFAKKDPRYTLWCKGVGRSKKWKERDPNRLASAVEFLEEKYILPGDSNWNFKGSRISTSSHHLDDFCHHPTLIGMICCILVQFTGTTKYHPAHGEAVPAAVTVNEYGYFVSNQPYGKVFAGILNWFFGVAQTLKNQKGHLMSDMAGSISAVKSKHRGAGIPGTVMATLKELSILPCFNGTSFPENLRKAYRNGIGEGASQLDLGVLNNLFNGASSKFDMRTELAVEHELKKQLIPTIINEVVVRAFYFIRRFMEQMKIKSSIADIEWKKLLPVKNRTIVRMMTVASGTFCLTDLSDAAIRAGVKSGGDISVFFSKFILRVNFVGIGRFTIAVGADLCMEARKARMEIAAMSGEIALTAIEAKKVIVETAAINKKTEDKINKMKAIAANMDNYIF